MSWFVLDLISLFPYKLFFASSHHATTQIPRLLRAFRMKTSFREVDERIHLKSKQRLFLFGALLIMIYHIIACLYSSITYLEGFSHKDDAWLPTDDIAFHRLNSTHYIDTKQVVYAADSTELRSVGITQYFRSLYYAANVLTALGRVIEPGSDTQYAAALLFNLSGFFITAIVVDNVQKRFTASALEQTEPLSHPHSARMAEECLRTSLSRSSIKSALAVTLERTRSFSTAYGMRTSARSHPVSCTSCRETRWSWFSIATLIGSRECCG